MLGFSPWLTPVLVLSCHGLSSDQSHTEYAHIFNIIPQDRGGKVFSTQLWQLCIAPGGEKNLNVLQEKSVPSLMSGHDQHSTQTLLIKVLWVPGTSSSSPGTSKEVAISLKTLATVIETSCIEETRSRAIPHQVTL